MGHKKPTEIEMEDFRTTNNFVPKDLKGDLCKHLWSLAYASAQLAYRLENQEYLNDERKLELEKLGKKMLQPFADYCHKTAPRYWQLIWVGEIHYNLQNLQNDIRANSVDRSEAIARIKRIFANRETMKFVSRPPLLTQEAIIDLCLNYFFGNHLKGENLQDGVAELIAECLNVTSRTVFNWLSQFEKELPDDSLEDVHEGAWKNFLFHRDPEPEFLDRTTEVFQEDPYLFLSSETK